MAQQGHLVTLGIQPTAPSTGYGYIQRGEALRQDGPHAVFRVQAFAEKPDAERARSYLASGDFTSGTPACLSGAPTASCRSWRSTARCSRISSR